MKLKKYRQTIAIGLSEASAYKMTVLSQLMNSILMLVLFYALWSAIASAGTLEGGLQKVMTYLVLGQVISRGTNMNTESFLGDKIRKGTITNELKRPIPLRSYTYCHEIGWKLLQIITTSIPLMVLGILFFNVRMPSAPNMALFLVSCFLALNLVFSVAYITSLLTFWTKVSWSVRMMRNLVTDLFSGRMFPLYLLPAGIKPLFDVLPFQGMVDTPVQIFMGSVTGRELYWLLGKQILWIIILLLIGELVWRKAKKKLTVQGG